MSKYNCIQFDMDGTLVDSIPIILESFQRALFQVYAKREINPEILKSSIGLPLKESFKNYPETDHLVLQNAYIAYYDQLQENGIPLFDGVREMLELLRDGGMHLAIVTSKRIVPTLKLISNLRLADFFEVIVGKEMTTQHKPNGEPIIKCMELMGITNKKQVLYVGDSLHDLYCAKNAGVDIAIVEWTKMDREELKKGYPNFWLQTPIDLCNFVLQNSRN